MRARSLANLCSCLLALSLAGCLSEGSERSGAISGGEGEGEGEGEPPGGNGNDDGKDDGKDDGNDDGKDEGKGDGRGDGDRGGDGNGGDESKPECGNGEKEPGEACDGADFGDLTCVAMGHYGGDLGCAHCKAIETECTEPPPDERPECGNGVKEPGEACDLEDFGGLTCVALGYDEGTLKCTDECEVKAKACSAKAANCGNGQLDPGETCDGGVGELTCEELGFEGGTLRCDRLYCFLDTKNCE